MCTTQHVNETQGGHIETHPTAEKEQGVRHPGTCSEVQWYDSRGAGGCDEGRTGWCICSVRQQWICKKGVGWHGCSTCGWWTCNKGTGHCGSDVHSVGVQRRDCGVKGRHSWCSHHAGMGCHMVKGLRGGGHGACDLGV